MYLIFHNPFERIEFSLFSKIFNHLILKNINNNKEPGCIFADIQGVPSKSSVSPRFLMSNERYDLWANKFARRAVAYCDGSLRTKII